MIKKTLLHSVTVLKVSTWISLIVALLVLLAVSFFVAFPVFFKAPIEQQLSEASGLEVKISNIIVGFQSGNITVKFPTIEATSAKTQQTLLGVKDLQWQLNWSNLFNDTYPHNITIDILSIYADNNAFKIADLQTFITPKVLQYLGFLESISINKTRIIDDYHIELMPLLLTLDESKLQLTIIEQKIADATFDIHVTFLLDQLGERSFHLPITIAGEDFNLLSELKLYHQQGHDFLEFNSVAKQMNIVNMSQYLPTAIVGTKASEWMHQAFKSGELEHIDIQVKQNLSKENPTQVSFKAHLSNAELLFDPNWQSLKQLDADISIENTRLDVKVNTAVLNKLTLQNIDVQMLDMSKDKLNIGVTGQVDAQSEKLLEFLQAMPLNSVVEPLLEKFTLSGAASGKVSLNIPLNQATAPIIDVDLTIEQNHLSVLAGAVVVDKFSSKVAFYDNQITTNGKGYIRGIPFNIRVNPSDRATDKASLFAFELSNDDGKFDVYITQKTEQLWHGKVTADSLQTDIEIAFNDGDLPSVTLSNLKVAKLDEIKDSWQIFPSDIPNIHLKSNGVYIGDYQLPDFKVDLHTGQEVLNINNLEFQGVGVNQDNLVFNGAWLKGITTLVAQAKGDKLSDFLTKMKVKEPVKGGKFEFDVRLFCQCQPWRMSFKNVTGYASINVQQGVFTNQGPSITRVLSLLNIQSIAKRLKLKIDDLTNKGFTYEQIQASVYLEDSLARIEHFNLSATSSAIRLTGDSNLVNQQYNLAATVRPEIVDAVPIATYLAGGGLAGLGVWLADKVLFDSKVMNAIVDNVAEFNYKITGSWDNPIIQ